ncbi:MAG: hypothetical protein V4490_04190, partial [Pseudomonadota bacterium]
MLRLEQTHWPAPTVLAVTFVVETPIPIVAGQYVTLHWPDLPPLILSLAIAPELSPQWVFHLRTPSESPLAQTIL